MRRRARILVTDGEQRSSLSVVRSLGAAGHDVLVCCKRTPSLAGRSRYVRGQFALPDPLGEPERFVDGLERLARTRDVEVVLPTTDESLSAVLARRDRFDGIRLPLPDDEAYRAVSDKQELLRVARGLGIAVPEQVVVREPGDLADVASLEPPLVMKPSRSVVGGGDDRRKLQASHAESHERLRRLLAELPAEAFPVLVQRRIDGEGRGVFLLMDDGDPAAIFGHRRLREKPPSGGVSVYRESVRPDPELLRQSVDLLRAFGWEGVAMVEYKMDAATGTPYLMEVNGRFWGSLQLAVDAGVDFPALLIRSALGELLPPPPDYPDGVRLRWIWGDVDHLVSRVRRPHDGAGTVRSTGRLHAVGEVLGSWRPGERWETLRFSDPRPFLKETADWWRAL